MAEWQPNQHPVYIFAFLTTGPHIGIVIPRFGAYHFSIHLKFFGGWKGKVDALPTL
jgi:hypothetical protein